MKKLQIGALVSHPAELRNGGAQYKCVAHTKFSTRSNLSSSLLSLSPLFTLSNFACVPVPYFSIIQTFFNYVGHSEGEV